MAQRCNEKDLVAGKIRGLVCPPSATSKFLRFIGRNLLGISMGSNVLASLDLSKFFVSAETYSQNTIILRQNDKPIKIHPPTLNLGERRQIARFIFSDEMNINYDITRAIFTISVENGSESYIEIPFPKPTSSPIELGNNEYIIEFIKNWIETTSLNDLYVVETSENILEIKTLTKGLKVDFTLDINYTIIGETATDIIEEVIEPIIIRNHIRYPSGSYKTIFMIMNFWEDTNQFIEWAWDSDILEHGNNPNAFGVTWHKAGKIMSLSGANDFSCDDRNMIEPIWVRNLENCRVDINVLTIA